jgi:hypothetical protein
MRRESMAMIRRLLANPLILPGMLAGLVGGCAGDETQPGEDHTPTSYTVSIDGNPATPPYTLTAGETALVQITFFNAAQENLDDVESGHFARLSFSPITLATAVRTADHHFQFDVTGDEGGTGTVTVGFGHDDSANEVSFPPAAVTVLSGGGNPNPD